MNPTTPPPPPLAPGGGAVLDTNAALDALVFADPRAAALMAAILAGQVRWLASLEMREELGRVLARPAFAARPASKSALASFDRIVTMRPTPPAARVLVCSDPDDQTFLDLALAEPTRWLVTRDKALLALCRPALQCGLTIVAPEAWNDSDARRVGFG